MINFKSEKIFLKYLVKWLFIAGLIGIFSGTASAFFLTLLERATEVRQANRVMIYFLPLGGFAVAILYHFWGRSVEAGNNLILEQIHTPKKILQLRMAPMVLFGTVITHLFGGSAGREGSALQMGASLADQLTKIFKFTSKDRKIILIAGMAAGFGSVFGTPLAGAIFGIEVYVMGKLSYEALLPAFVASIIADEVTQKWWGVHHSVYSIVDVPEATLLNIFYASVAGILFGITGKVFSLSISKVKRLIGKVTTFKPLHAVIGGIAIVLLTEIIGTTRYNGLGLDVISETFVVHVNPYDFALKILFTAITLGAGYKGGEVTCLFFIGATLGNALSLIIPLPMAVLAGMGFVAVFGAASNTPLACTIMGIELFGTGVELFVGIACVTAYLFSGHSSIYSKQLIGRSKGETFHEHEGKKIHEIDD